MEEKTYTGYSLSERIRWIVAFSLIAVLLIGMMVSLVLVLSIKQEERRPQRFCRGNGKLGASASHDEYICSGRGGQFGE